MATSFEGIDPTDPYAREAQTFPVLTPEQAERVAAFGRVQDLQAGEIVFARGQRGVDFFLVLRGAIEIFEENEAGEPHVITVHGVRQFTGELDLFNNRMILVGGRARPGTRVARLDRASFRAFMAADPEIGEIVMRAFILRRVGLIRYAQGGVTMVGTRDAASIAIQRFLTRNGYPHRLVDAGTPEATALMAEFGVGEADLPILIHKGERLLRRPSLTEVADGLGLTEELDPDHVHDLIVVGAGPSGLAAAVYAASEGLDTLIVEAEAPGGQAGTSSKIENYLGFPTGISGQALAGRAQIQAQKFGAKMAISRRAVRLDCDATPFRIVLEDGACVRGRAIVIATGARYRSLDLPNHCRYEGQGIHYAATAMEAQLCSGQAVAVVGGGNSAGQAAVFLARHAAHVYLLVRGPGLAATMSDYLIQRIHASPQITLLPHTEVSALAGDHLLRTVSWRNRLTGAEETREVSSLFLMIGAMPNTDWLGGCLPLDDRGFILTGRSLDGDNLFSPYATVRPGIFAVGDVRSGSVKRVASGVGEGSVVVQAVHSFLADTAPPPAARPEPAITAVLTAS